MTQENHDKAEKFLKEKYLTGNEKSTFGWYEVISILAEYTEHSANLPVIKSVCECGAEHSNEAKYVGQCNYCLKAIV